MKLRCHWRLHPAFAADAGVAHGIGKAIALMLANQTQVLIFIYCKPHITLDLVKNLPTALVIASNSPQMREHGKRALTTPTVKINLSDDILSYEYASALKNIVALEVGIVTGLGLGDNFRALVLAEGMAEIAYLMARMGLQSDVFYTLAGLSDIFLTYSSHFARNYTIGHGHLPSFASRGYT